MKSLFFTTSFVLFISTFIFSQTQWSVQNSGTSSILQDVFFVDQDYGWIAGANLILHTTDGGNTWVNQPAPPVSLFYVSIYFTDRMNGWACGNDARIIHTSDGGNTWVTQPNPYVTFNPILYGIYFANQDTGWAVGGDHGSYPSFINRRVILYTTNGGSSWDFQLNQSGVWPLYCVGFSSSSDGYAAGQYGGILHTTNGGNNWSSKTPISSYQPFSIFSLTSNVGWASGEYLGVPHVSFISKTTDGGTTWDIQTFGQDEYIQDIQFVDNLNGWAVGGTVGGSGGSQHTTILHTTDGGNNWEMQSAPSTSTLLGVSFADINNGWAVGVDGVVLKADNVTPVELTSFTGKVSENNVMLSWRTATETNNNGFQIERFKNSKIENSKKWKTLGFVEGHGTTTEEHNYSFVDRNISMGEYQYRLKQIDYDGSFEYSDVVDINISSPTKFSLKQNYPNPFNPSTTIQYSMPEGGKVRLSIYNALGEEVRVLVNNFKESGDYKINFNAAGLTSGIYFYKLSLNNFSSIKKMILLK